MNSAVLVQGVRQTKVMLSKMHNDCKMIIIHLYCISCLFYFYLHNKTQFVAHSIAGEIENINHQPNSKGAKNTWIVSIHVWRFSRLIISPLYNMDSRAGNKVLCSYFCFQEDAHKDGGSGFVIVANSKSPLENKEIVTGTLQYATLH